MEVVKIKLVDKKSRMPEKQTDLASGFDAFVRDYEIRPDGLVIYYLGIITEIPPHMEGIVAARSSLTKTRFVVPNGFGLIDADYRDEWQFRIRYIPLPTDMAYPSLRLNENDIPYQLGDRCCQIFFREKLNISFKQVHELTPSNRAGGFGSTGK